MSELAAQKLAELRVDEVTTTTRTSTTTTPLVGRKISQTQDSDSGHERASSSSASNCSDETASDGSRQHLKLLEIVSSDDSESHDHDQADLFVDASDNLRPLDSFGGNDLLLDRSPAVEHAEIERPNRSREQDGAADLEARLAETTEILRLALSNEFIKALELCEERAKSELYAGLAHATLSFLRAALTLEQADLQAALAGINQAFEVSQQHRRPVSTASLVMRFLYKPNYNDYTDDQIHAELVNAEAMLLLSLISFLADQSVLCLMRGAFRIRACYQRYKECLYILDHRHQWSSEAARRHFESGVRMGHGIFNLLMSYLPRRVLKILEYVGFSGSRSVGVGELDRSIELADGLRSVLSALVILTYHSYVENLFGLGAYDERKVEQLNNTHLSHYPDSAFFLLFLGRYHQMQGELSQAIESFEKCCRVQQDWRQFHSICHWEIMWCYACQMDWPRAAHYANLLRNHSKWSPASYQYQYGTFLYAQLIHEQRQGSICEQSPEFKRRLAEIRQIIDKVPSLRIRYAGKTIPADKFAITRAEKFARQSNRLSLPALEFLYIWNIFCTLKNNPRQVEALLASIDSEIGHISEQMAKEARRPDETGETRPEDGQAAPPSGWIDDLCLMHLLRGICLKYLDRFPEAERALMRVIELEHQVVVDKFLVPHSAMELALLKLHLKEYSAAKSWIKRARHDYTGYLLETIVHFRLHAASRLIRVEQQRRQSAERELEQSREADEDSPFPSPSAGSLGRKGDDAFQMSAIKLE